MKKMKDHKTKANLKTEQTTENKLRHKKWRKKTFKKKSKKTVKNKQKYKMVLSNRKLRIHSRRRSNHKKTILVKETKTQQVK